MRKKPPLVLIIIIMNIRLKVKYLDFKLIDKQHVQKFLSLIKKVFFTNRNFLTILIDTFEYFSQNMRLRVIHQCLSQRKKKSKRSLSNVQVKSERPQAESWPWLESASPDALPIIKIVTNVREFSKMLLLVIFYCFWNKTLSSYTVPSHNKHTHNKHSSHNNHFSHNKHIFYGVWFYLIKILKK